MEATGNQRSGGKGPPGLTTLHQPTSPLPAADIIFVHGLGGGSRKTWSYSDSDANDFWPERWLSTDPAFANVGIHSFGYYADWIKPRSSILQITDFANSLLHHVSSHTLIRQGSGGIIFCGHSLGGCVAKMAYILARRDASRVDIANRICSMIFLGTPHRGSDLAKILSGILSVSLSHKPFVKSLTLDSSELKRINDLFHKVAGSLRLWSFYETLPTRILGIGTIVVEPHSATLGYPGEEIAPLHADHRQVCKFKSSDDPNYKMVRNSLLTAVDAARTQQRQNFVNKCARLRRFLQIQSMAEDDFDALQRLKKTGSCEWLLHRTQFTSWAAGEDGHSSIFWLTAIPGSGKSVLSSHILATLKSRPHTICSGFTFQNSKSGTSAFSECLRSLAYQMAQGDPEVLERLLRFEEEAVPWNLLDELHVWRKLFIENIFEVPSIAQHIWVIDGLDECANLQAVFTNQLLSNAPSDLKAFITSRPVEAINREIRALGTRVSHYQLTLDDTAEDIAGVVMAELDKLGIPEDEEDRRAMCDTILRRSSGMFLWVRLVLREFESPAACSTEGIHSALREIPDGLSQLYTKCLEPTLEAKRTLKLVKPILTWAILGSRALTAQEIRCVVTLEVQETLQNIEMAIPSICAQLISVDKNSKMVHAIHETFHEFLLSEECPHTIKIDKQRSHSRIATLLLQYLAGEHMRPVIREDSTYVLQGSGSKTDMTLVDYAARYFSDHLSESDPADGEVLGSLCRFLESDGVLAWMALAATDKDTRRLAKVAAHLENYLDRRQEASDTDTTGSRHDLIRQWATDLFRFSCKYGPQLATSPGSFFDLIPSLCPLDTAISKAFRWFTPRIFRRAQRTVLLDKWSPILATTECDNMSMGAHGSNLFAGLRGSVVGIYDRMSTQWLLDIPLTLTRGALEISQSTHEFALAFSAQDRYLAVYANYHILVFEPLTGALLHDYALGKADHEAGSMTSLSFSASDHLVLVTAKRLISIEWDGRPGNHDTIRQTQLPTKESPQIPPSDWWLQFATDGSRSIVVFAVLPWSKTVMLWDSGKEEIIAEFSFDPKGHGWESGCNPQPVKVPTPFSASQPSWPPKTFEPSTGGEGTSPHEEYVLAWINPSLSVPALVLLWVRGGKYKFSIVNYSSGAVLYDWSPQPWYLNPDATRVASACFSGDGSAFVFLHQDMSYIYLFSTEGDGCIRVTFLFLPMGYIYDELRPNGSTKYHIWVNSDGSWFMLGSPDTLTALVVPRRRGYYVDDRRFYRSMLFKGMTKIPLPAKSNQGGSCLVGTDYDAASKYEARIALIFTRSLRTVVVWNHDSNPPGGLKGARRWWTNLVTNNERNWVVWECKQPTNEGATPVEFVVADLTPPLTQWDEKMDDQNRPTLNPILHQVVDSACNLLLLNESGDRLVRRTQDDCELWELPSGIRLATWNLWELWERYSEYLGWKKKHMVGPLPLVQHPTDPGWLLCVNVYMPKGVAMLSWRDFTLSLGRIDEESEVIPCGDPAEPRAEVLSLRQPSRPGRLAALVHCLEAAVPETTAAYDFRAEVWRSCFVQYIRACMITDSCLDPVCRVFTNDCLLPIAFLGPSRTLVFLWTDLWIYSAQVAQNILITLNDEWQGPTPQTLPSRPAWHSGSGVFAPSCAACGRGHPVRARRHIYTGFLPKELLRCLWSDGGTAPDGRRKMDFSFWGIEPTDRIIVEDALRYADEVEWVEYRNESGQVWKREWKLVEKESLDEMTETKRFV